MHLPALLLIVVLAAAVVDHAACAAAAAAAAAAGTPAAQFWEEMLPGTPMPPTIAELVQEGTNHSPLKEPSSSRQTHMDFCLSYRICTAPPSAAMATTGVFFRQDKVRAGSVMTVHIPPVDLPAILPRADAEKAPFANVDDVLATFAIAPGSAEAATVRGTVSRCQAAPTAGEQMACTASLEDTVRAAARMLGTRRLSVAVSALSPREGLPLQEYEVAAAAPVAAGRRHVTCHDDPFPYAVYRCHTEKEASMEAYVLTLRGRRQQVSGSSSSVDMVAICHLDTSNWSPAHPAFETLNLQPGGAPVCHFMPYADMLFSEN